MRAIHLPSLLLLPLGCVGSPARVEGKLLLPDGNPAAGWDISLVNTTSYFQHEEDRARTKDDGTFVLYVPGGLTGQKDERVFAAVASASDRSSARVWFHAKGDETIKLPALRMWQSNLSQVPSDNGFWLNWDPLAVEHQGFRVGLWEQGRPLEVFHFPLTNEIGMIVGSEIVEDRATNVLVRAGEAPQTWLPTDIMQSWHSPLIQLSAGTRVPLSRGAPCRISYEWRYPCAFTDGDFGSEGIAFNEFLIDLGGVKSFDTIVLRKFSIEEGASDSVIFEVGNDERPLTEIGSLVLGKESGFGIFKTPSPATARYVRISVKFTPGTVRQLKAREISIFEFVAVP